jgi:hypothetical protein
MDAQVEDLVILRGPESFTASFTAKPAYSEIAMRIL